MFVILLILVWLYVVIRIKYGSLAAFYESIRGTLKYRRILENPELAEAVTTSVVKAGPTTRAFFMREHGILAVGATAADCYHTCELLEDSAKIAVLDRLFKA